MKPSTFVKAAELVVNGETFSGPCCCWAIELASFTVDESIQSKAFFRELLRPEVHPWGFWYINNRSDGMDLETPEQYANARAFGLLLCAELLKDEQKKQKK